jgi:hypothetical protein
LEMSKNVVKEWWALAGTARTADMTADAAKKRIMTFTAPF